MSKNFFFYYHLPSSKTRCLMRILDHNRFYGREYGKDTLLIFYPTKRQTATKCCKKTSSQAHMYTTQFRNTQEDSCRLNGWQPAETKRVLTRTWGFPGGAVVENLPANAGDTGSSPGLGRYHMPRSN